MHTVNMKNAFLFKTREMHLFVHAEWAPAGPTVRTGRSFKKKTKEKKTRASKMFTGQQSGPARAEEKKSALIKTRAVPGFPGRAVDRPGRAGPAKTGFGPTLAARGKRTGVRTTSKNFFAP